MALEARTFRQGAEVVDIESTEEGRETYTVV